MDEKYSTAIRTFDNQKAFTLVELIVVIAIISILSAMGSTYFTYLKFRAGDSQAFVEGRNLMTAVNDAFMNLEDINFGDSLADGDITGPIGDTTSGGGARTPIFTFSPEIRARMEGQSTTSPGGGFLTAYIWSINGTNDLGAHYSGKKEYQYIIDENANIIWVPSF